MNKNCQLFYKRLRILFPSIGFAEGKFLRDIKMQLRDFSMENSGAKYEDVVEFFGNPEEVYVNYIQSRRREEVYLKLQIRKLIKWVCYVISFILISVFMIICFYLYKGYYSFHDIMPETAETIIEKGEYFYEEN